MTLIQSTRGPQRTNGAPPGSSPHSLTTSALHHCQVEGLHWVGILIWRFQFCVWKFRTTCQAEDMHYIVEFVWAKFHIGNFRKARINRTVDTDQQISVKLGVNVMPLNSFPPWCFFKIFVMNSDGYYRPANWWGVTTLTSLNLRSEVLYGDSSLKCMQFLFCFRFNSIKNNMAAARIILIWPW
jgi:hypothetical protein